MYLDDIVTFSKTPKDHDEHTRLVLLLLEDAGVTHKLKTCAFSTNRIDYLGHVIKHRKLEVANHTADEIQNLQVQTTVNQLRTVLEICNVFRQSVSKFGRITSPLSKPLRRT